jgi:hypothetical protein
LAHPRRDHERRPMTPITIMIAPHSHASILDPRHAFLTPAEVMARYRWGHTKGYEVMRTRRDGFPAGISGRYRLDTLLRWEDEHLGLTPEPPALPQLPPRKRAVRRERP